MGRAVAVAAHLALPNSSLADNGRGAEAHARLTYGAGRHAAFFAAPFLPPPPSSPPHAFYPYSLFPFVSIARPRRADNVLGGRLDTLVLS